MSHPSTTTTPRPQECDDGGTDALRARIDSIDTALLALWRERSGLSQQVGRARVAGGGTRLVLSRERQILARFKAALGEDGVAFALLLLRAGRGPL
ncbi:hypothetical protein GCM10010124_22460 [Pilimelia terevasa]|uniref:Chorismate mutase domain-containing protein n=1 Tax=Pilimelia terevasa TaxID=53372 RepID=A0A8J3BKM7_9ACTN|nr:chorismate mutase [Pilimelia terevasa]GGK29202.1 hypothetical protein GCM10010124_22460 [Pilimelia terevasa]